MLFDNSKRSPVPVLAPAGQHSHPWQTRIGILLILVLALPTLLYPYGRDQAMFAYVGAVWREGGLPYRDAWDVKLPGIYAAYALVGGASWGPRLLDLLATAGAAWVLVRLARQCAAPGQEAAPLSAVFAPVLLGLYTFGALDYWNLAQTETLIGPLAAGAVLAALGGRYYLAGTLIGAAATLKTTAVLFIPVLVLAALCPASPLTAAVRKRRWRDAAVLLLGTALPPLAFVAYFATRDGLPYLWELVRVQAEYAGGDPRTSGLNPLELARILGLGTYLPLVAVSAAALVPWLRDESRLPRDRWVIAAWWALALAQIVLQRRFYLYHWSVLTPAAAFLAADGLARLGGGWVGGRFLAGSPRPTSALLLAGLLVCIPLARQAPVLAQSLEVLSGRTLLREYHRRFQGVFDYSVADGMDAAAHAAVRSGPEDRLLVLGFEPHVYLYSGRRAPTRHASDAPLFGETSIRLARRQAWLHELLNDLRRSRPLYWIEWEPPASLARPAWAGPLAAFRFRHYREEGKYGRFRVYRRQVRPSTRVDTPREQG